MKAREPDPATSNRGEVTIISAAIFNAYPEGNWK